MRNKFLIALFALSLASSCTDLKEELKSDIPSSEVTSKITAADLLKTAYNQMKGPYQDQARLWSAQEHTGDLALGPTRGPDWDDNGIWRSLHAHSWTADHAFLQSTFSELLSIVYQTTLVLQFKPTPQEDAEARYLRAYAMHSVLDGWGQVPFREAGSSLLEDAKVLTPAETVDFILKELDAIAGALPDGPTNRANKTAAQFLKMKMLMNKGMYLNRETPTFAPADMAAAIAVADQITASGKYTVSDIYFDNFAPDNDKISKENIWTSENEGGKNSGNVRSRWFCTLHYAQNPSGWNGFATLSDFYNSFEDGDVRKKSSYTGMTDVSGINAGFLIGQQKNEKGEELMDRKGNKLAFTPDVKLKEGGNDLEITGIRVIKYPIDYKSGDNADNDYVYFRYADVLMYKAEALLRSGQAGAGLDIVNQIRAKRKTSALATLTTDNLLAERGREFYWEGNRRTDLLRFGKFLAAWQEKAGSGKERLLFPIPTASLASNPNLKQNPGY
jgi:starch-binding outer membrane protein, SusD/RagB family